jgi:hypothetical protein
MVVAAGSGVDVVIERHLTKPVAVRTVEAAALGAAVYLLLR